MRAFKSIAIAAVASFSLASLAEAATLTHLWTLDGTNADSAGSTPITFNEPGSGPTGFYFGSNLGLSAYGAMPTSGYSIDMTFDFDDVSGYNKVVDFKNKASDTGLYVYHGALYFYNVAIGPQVVTGNQTFRLTLTRDDATNQVAGYINGALQFSFVDVSGLAVFSATDAVAHFFQDDGQHEYDSGFVDYIRVFDGALTADEVAALTNPVTPAVPLPAAGWLLVAGIGAIGAMRRR